MTGWRRRRRGVVRGSQSTFDDLDLSRGLKHQSARGSAVTISAQLIRLLLTLLSTAILARLLTPRDFGLLAMTTAVTGLAVLFKDFGLSTATVQKNHISHQIASSIFWINVVVSFVLMLMVIAVAPLLATFYDDDRVGSLTRVFALYIFVGGLSSQHQALLERQMRFGPVAAADLTGLTAGVATSIALAMNGGGYWALAALAGVHIFVSSGLLWWFAGWIPGRPRRTVEVTQMIRFGGSLTGFNVVNYLARNLDNVLIGWRWGAAQLGLYSRAYRLLMLPLQQVNAPVAKVMIPALSRLQDDPARYRAAYLRALETLSLVTIPSVALLIATSDWVIQLVLGNVWLGAVSIFAWLGVAGAVQTVSSSTGWLFISQDRTGEMFRWGLVATTLSVAAFFVGLPHGAIGVAAAYAVTSVMIQSPLLFWYVGRRGPVTTKDLLYAVRFPAIVAATLYGAARAVRLLLGPDFSPSGGLLIVLLIAVATSALLLHLPQGRKRLTYIIDLVRALRRPEKD